MNKVLHYILISCLCLMAGCHQSPKEKKKTIAPAHAPVAYETIAMHHDATTTTANIFGPAGMQVGHEQQTQIKQMLEQVAQLSEREQSMVAACIAQTLTKKESTSTLDAFAVRYYTTLAHEKINKVTKKAKLISCAQHIINFLHFEQEHIFISTASINKYIRLVQQYPLPTLVNPWHSHDALTVINHLTFADASSASGDVQVQGFWIEAASMLAQTAVMASSSIANKAISELQENVSTQLQQAITTTQTEAKTARDQASTAMKKEYKTDMQAFGQASKNIGTQQTQYSDLAKLEADYVTKGLSVQQAGPQNLFNAVAFDQMFTASVMHTPNSYLTWRNPFPVGDWYCNPATQTIMQRNMINLVSQTTDAQGNPQNSTALAQNNSIFAEYFTVQPTYTIAGTITLYAVSYPFFVGIMLNKQRWISGNSTTLFSSRLVGLLGNSMIDQTSGTPTLTCNIYGAEQRNLTDDELKQALAHDPKANPFQSPLYQIIHEQVSPVGQLDAAPLTTLVQAPVTYMFEITTTTNSLEIYLWNSKDPKPTKPYLIQNLQEQMFMWHGIGFMSPGALAEFKLTSPTDAWFASLPSNTGK